jgi:amino acid adenylation domain-containing protein
VEVGLDATRSVAMVVGLLGILQAGGAYLPLEPRGPAARRRREVADHGVRLVVGDPALGAELGVPVIAVPATAPATPVPFVAPALAAEHLAYVLTTSGSTGTPKGVLVSHGGLTHYVQAAVAQYAVQAGEVVPVVTPLAFDATVTSLLVPLAAGAELQLLPEGEEVAALAAGLATGAGYGLVKLTPAHLSAVAGLRPDAIRRGAARALVVGGEALLTGPVAAWRAQAPDVRVINEYGPTETVVGCLTYEVTATSPTAGTVPIGTPLPRTTCYVLDAQLALVPSGSRGTLYVGGAGVARGYGRQPGVTAARFVADPFGPPGSRLYRTGDVVRARADGALEFLGRDDEQVKLRGYRVELGEVEAALASHPAVTACAVTVDERPAGARRLVGYVVSATAIPSEVLQAHLRERLPEYMVPALLVPVAALPLTPRGKVDRAALPPPTDTAPPVAAPPQGPREQHLARLWTDILGLPDIGRHDNFFEIGGDSILATQIVARLREQLAVELPLRLVFEAPTIATLAPRIAQAQQEQQEQMAWRLPPLTPRPDPAIIPLSFAEERLWLLDRLDEPSGAYTSTLHTRLRGNLDLPALERSLSEVCRRHEVLRSRYETSSAALGCCVSRRTSTRYSSGFITLHGMAGPAMC